MRNLLAILEGGTLGTQAEPSTSRGVPNEKKSQNQCGALGGTCGTLGTLRNSKAHSDESTANRIADIADAWRERIAIILESGDVSEDDARRTAALEAGEAFVRAFLPHEYSEAA